MSKKSKRGPVAYIAGPLLFVAAVGLEVAAHPFEARAAEIQEIQPSGERRARLVRTLDRDGARQLAEEKSWVRKPRVAVDRLTPLWSTLLALGLAAAAAHQARLQRRIAAR